MDKITDDRKPRTFMDASGEEIFDKYVDISIAGMTKGKAYEKAMWLYFMKFLLCLVVSGVVILCFSLYIAKDFNEALGFAFSLFLPAVFVIIFIWGARMNTVLARNFIDIRQKQKSKD
jgi:glucan phosphoethanolaminetransferase (alkaline phosphatase superfamily)